MSVSPNAVNKGYDVLPSRSVKFNTQRDNPPSSGAARTVAPILANGSPARTKSAICAFV